MAKENVRMKINTKNTRIQSLRIKGLLPRPVVIRNLFLKNVAFYLVDRKIDSHLKLSSENKNNS